MKTYVNLLPFAYRRRQLILLRLRLWFRVWGLAAIVMAIVGWHHWSQLRAGEARLASLRHQHAPVVKAKTESDALRQRIQELQQREVLALSLADEQPMLTLLGWLSRAARQCGGAISIQELKLDRQEPPNANRRTTGVLTLDGVATDDQTVARFTEALKNSQTFVRVELKQTSTFELGGMQARSYTVECAF